jgi:hypothetical protein
MSNLKFEFLLRVRCGSHSSVAQQMKSACASLQRTCEQEQEDVDFAEIIRDGDVIFSSDGITYEAFSNGLAPELKKVMPSIRNFLKDERIKPVWGNFSRTIVGIIYCLKTEVHYSFAMKETVLEIGVALGIRKKSFEKALDNSIMRGYCQIVLDGKKNGTILDYTNKGLCLALKHRLQKNEQNGQYNLGIYPDFPHPVKS